MYPVTDSIPYASYYTSDAIITKNGDLLQVIEILDLVSDNSNLRQAVRQAIEEYLLLPDVFISLYLVRKKSSFRYQPSTNLFCDWLAQGWVDNLTRSPGFNNYSNKIYIALTLRVSFSGSTSVILGASRAGYLGRIKLAYDRLLRITGQVIEKLRDFSPRKLKVNEEESKSDFIQFLAELLNHSGSDDKVTDMDLSEQLADGCQVKFARSTFQMQGVKNPFGAILTIKSYGELDLNKIDQIIQFKSPFIINEQLYVSYDRKAAQSYERQKYLLETVKDQATIDNLKLAEVGQLCKHKITFSIVASSIAVLNHQVGLLAAQLGRLGILAVRADLSLENEFWARLPGNTELAVGMRGTFSNLVAGFFNFRSFFCGITQDKRWGRNITIFNSSDGNPFFFNINYNAHKNDNLLIVAPPNSGRTLLTNFIVSAAFQEKSRVLFLDITGKSIIFVKALGGHYNIFDPGLENSYKINLLNLKDNEINRSLVQELFIRMADQLPLSAEIIEMAVESIFILKSIEKFLIILDSVDGGRGSSIYKNLFALEAAPGPGQVLAINIRAIINKPMSRVIIYYLMYSFLDQLQGEPALIVLDEILFLLQIFTPRELQRWLELINQRNCSVIFSVDNVGRLLENEELAEVVSAGAITKLFFPMSDIRNYSYTILGLTKEDVGLIEQMPNYYYHFLFKSGEHALELTCNLDQFKEKAILSADKNSILYMQKLVKEYGPAPSDWLSRFYETYQS